MTQANSPNAHAPSAPSKVETSLAYIRYGLTISRREGLGYFFTRSLRAITRELARLYRFIRVRYHLATELSLMHVEDVEQRPASLAIPELDTLDIPSNLPSPGITTSMHDQLVLHGISSHNQQLGERNALLRQGNEQYGGRRVLFLAPIRVLSGGANLIILAARAMQRMGVNAHILNMRMNRNWFEKAFKEPDIPVIFADLEDVAAVASGYDAVIATSNPTVSWMKPVSAKRPDLPVGYYIQDYEPYFYPKGSHEFKRAAASYTLLPGMVRMATTAWIADMIMRYHQVDCNIVGAHLDSDLFRPRPRSTPASPDRPIRILAMIRPSTPRRNPTMTVSILKQASEVYGTRVEITLFGCDPIEPGFASLVEDLPCQLAGQLRPTQMANLLNEVDIFVDFSDFQALGLAALEAMACGLAVIVPARGGTDTYARHDENCLVVDTHDQTACYQALQRLIEDHQLRTNIQANAIATASGFFPEHSAINILNALFS